MTRTALIVGAGIGGLSAAIALRKAGWHIRVFERAASPRELGFGLAIAPNAFAGLRELGIADTVLGQAHLPRRGEIRRPNGAVLKRLELPPGALGGPMIVALRPALHGALLDSVGLDTISVGAAATGFTVTGDRVALAIRSDGRDHVAEGDLLVGADGIGSVVRQTLHPAQPSPRPCGIVAVRGAVHGVLEPMGGLDAVLYLGRGVEAMLVRASATGIYWYLSLARQLVPADMRDPAAVLAHLSPRFDATFREVTGATTELRFDELVDRDPLPFWGKEGVTLLGDAAHPLLPHTGQGAAMAIVDGVALGKVLSGGAAVAPALRSYENERREKTARLLMQGRRTARVMRTTNSVAVALRDLVIRLLPVKQFAKRYVRINRSAGTAVEG